VPANVIRLYSGVDSVRAADALRIAIQGRRDAWPYVHRFAPPSSEDVLVIGTANVETVGNGPIEVVKYQVNSGKRFFLRAVILGCNISFVPGDATFTVDRNSPVGVTDSQFLPEHGLINVPVQLGSAIYGPFHLQRAREFAPLDVVRVKGTNVTLSAGPTNQYVCGLFGYEVPVLDIHSTR
jgi:hypothetical protein